MQLKRRRFFWSADVALFVLIATCFALVLVVAYLRPVLLLPVGVVLLLALLCVGIGLRRFRKALRRLLNGKRGLADAENSGMAGLSIPVAVMSDKVILWYNKAFREQIAAGEDMVSLPMNKIVPGLDSEACLQPGGQDIAVGEKRFSAHCSVVGEDSPLHFVLFVEDTKLKMRAAEYLASRPSVVYIVIDTYDEIAKELRESDRTRLISSIDRALEHYIGKTSGFLRRLGSSRYLALVEERHLEEMVKNRFDILDTVRKLDEESQLVTLSIGVGHGGSGFKECEEMALQALDLALGRGGDQAAVCSPEGFSFFGGVSRSVEKRSKVKSRIIAASIKGQIASAEKVFIMGHKNSDMDSLGAAMGMLRFSFVCGKKASIVIDKGRSLAGSLISELVQGGYGEVLVSPAQAAQSVDENTLLIIVDTHMKYLLESAEVFERCGAKIVIDHHRRMPGHIEDAVVFYHEPYASSASELVSELLQYVGEGKEDRPAPLEAEALLAGIMLDTRTFSLHVGVRTFEAAAYLRRMGAETENVKRLFSVSMDDYLYRAHLVSEAKVYDGCAVVVSDKVPFECEVVAPQAANDLLGIEEVEASVVAIKQGDTIRISARSMGGMNVQLIMEKLGGGGHLTMAGAQLEGLNLEEAENRIVNAISVYQAERALAASPAQ
ncbi:DHH family phosphoesterase [Ruminococcaceae bacterium OttesenSCG-928-I18]|nr:DHH family phosphoesterase [Ruminococcaceae bacterium OttesenSCG-928-I18]